MTVQPIAGGFHPLLRAWFADRFGAPTPAQEAGWEAIRSGDDVLLCAPTGSGKTLAAFTICLDGLVRDATAGRLADGVAVVYVSPLRALSTDVQVNLEVPLRELRERAASEGVALQPIRSAVRTGDTSNALRRRMLREPPHVLVTTPESLYLLLTAERSRAMLARVRTVIVDEIHAVACDKRGAHLALTLARLDALIRASGGPRPQRIGLSASVHSLNEIARFLSPRSRIVEVRDERVFDLAVQVPSIELGAVAGGELMEELYDRIAEAIRTHRTTLVFVATRRMSERVAFALARRLGDDAVAAHHGSLAADARREIEGRLKAGLLRAVVATASLELGIDIGTVDLVVQIGSPRSIAVALQRIGRSGHRLGAAPKGRLFPLTRDELLECAALVRLLRARAMDAVTIPRAPLDILAQQIVAECAQRAWCLDELYEMVRDAHPYRALARADFDAVVAMLADGIASSRGRSGAHLHLDRVNGIVRGRRGARAAAIAGAGAIPETAQYRVIAEPEGTVVGTLDEDFAIESSPGEIFLLGSTSWRIRRVEPASSVVRVEDARGAPPTIPFWRGEGPARTRELSDAVGALRAEIAARDDAAATALLREDCALDERGAVQAIAYVRAGCRALGVVPTHRRIVAERFFDDAGGMQLVVHAPLGARLNRAWALALRKRFCRSFDLELQAAATDDGFVISLTERHAFPLDLVFAFVGEAQVRELLEQAVLATPFFAARWRWNAVRALAVPRLRAGRRLAPQIQRMRAEDLLATVFPDQAACQENLSGPVRIPDHLLVRQTLRDCLEEPLDAEGLRALVGAIAAGEIETVAVETAQPSPFAHQILDAQPYAFLDGAPLEERRSRAVRLPRDVTEIVPFERDLDPDAVADVTASLRPDPRDAEELHDTLLSSAIVLPQPAWSAWFDELRLQRRAAEVRLGRMVWWTCAERAGLVRALHPQVEIVPDLPCVDGPPTPDDALSAAVAIVRGRLQTEGPRTAAELAADLRCDEGLVRAALVRLEGAGEVLRGRFRADVADDLWCDRRVLARIRGAERARRRRDAPRAGGARALQFFASWQHAVSGRRLHGVEGTLEIVRMLQGWTAPAAAWEDEILPARVADYRPDYLETLCRTGEVLWCRLRPHPAVVTGDGRKVRPTRLLPIALLLRDEAAALLPPRPAAPAGLSRVAQAVMEAIARRGAPFFGDLVRETRLLPAEVEEALWELVAAGLVTADGFDALRALSDPRRRLGTKGFRARPRSSAGRWSGLEGICDVGDPERHATGILARWGIAVRELAELERDGPPWRLLLPVFRRMEARGQIVGGRFIAGLAGEQFALPEAVELLAFIAGGSEPERSIRPGPHDPLAAAAALLVNASNRSSHPAREAELA